MNAHNTKKLSELVRIRRQYQRSIRLDADLGRMDALDGYVCHKTAADVLDAMAKQISGSNQRAFTWTGPFGAANLRSPLLWRQLSVPTKTFGQKLGTSCAWTPIRISTKPSP